LDDDQKSYLTAASEPVPGGIAVGLKGAPQAAYEWCFKPKAMRFF